MEKIRISIDVAKLPACAIYKNGEGRKFIIVEVAPRRDGGDQYGKTHTVSVWDAQAEQRVYVGNGKAETIAPQQQSVTLNDDDLPL